MWFHEGKQRLNAKFVTHLSLPRGSLQFRVPAQLLRLFLERILQGVPVALFSKMHFNQIIRLNTADSNIFT
jgi:hypothetical protein